MNSTKDATGYDSERLPTLAEQAEAVAKYEGKRTARFAVISQNRSRRMKGEAALPVPGCGTAPQYAYAYDAETGDYEGRAFKGCPLNGKQLFWLDYTKEPASNIDMKARNARHLAAVTLARSAGSPFQA